MPLAYVMDVLHLSSCEVHLWVGTTSSTLGKNSFSYDTSISHYYRPHCNFRESGQLSGLLPFPSACVVNQWLAKANTTKQLKSHILPGLQIQTRSMKRGAPLDYC